MTIKYLSEIPEQVNLPPNEFLQWLGGTSIIKAGRGETVILTCLMHGNEPSGFYAFYDLLKKLKIKDELKKTVYFIFINVKAALSQPFFSIRFCEGQNDMNRIWENDGINNEQGEIVKQIKTFVREKNPELLVDFHNTTGNNPVYLLTPPGTEESLLREYSFFSDLILLHPGKGQLVGWCRKFYKCFLVECGKNTLEESHQRAKEVLRKVLIYSGAKEGVVETKDKVKVASDLKTVVLAPNTVIAFADENIGKDVVFRTDLDQLNTKQLSKGTFLGWVNKPGVIEHAKLEIKDKRLLLKEDATLTFLTTHPPAITKDCLGYFVDIKELVFSN